MKTKPHTIEPPIEIIDLPGISEDEYNSLTQNVVKQEETGKLINKVEKKSPIVLKDLNFHPNKNQEEWLNTALELATDNIVEIAITCRQARTNFYRWMKQKGFEEWYLEAYKQGRKRWIPRLDRIGMNRAKRDFNYWKAMNQKAGELVDNVGTNVQINGKQVVAILGGVTNEDAKPPETGKNDQL